MASEALRENPFHTSLLASGGCSQLLASLALGTHHSCFYLHPTSPSLSVFSPVLLQQTLVIGFRGHPIQDAVILRSLIISAKNFSQIRSDSQASSEWTCILGRDLSSSCSYLDSWLLSLTSSPAFPSPLRHTDLLPVPRTHQAHLEPGMLLPTPGILSCVPASE